MTGNSNKNDPLYATLWFNFGTMIESPFLDAVINKVYETGDLEKIVVISGISEYKAHYLFVDIDEVETYPSEIGSVFDSVSTMLTNNGIDFKLKLMFGREDTLCRVE